MTIISRRRPIAVTLITALILTTIFVAAPLQSASKVDAVAPTPYPWSQSTSKTTGDYFVDTYGLPAGHVFENVTTDRLLDILSSNGNYYILLGGPEHPASQKVVKDINSTAKAKGITKIYHFDPFVDGYQLDITKTSGVGDWIGGVSVNFEDDTTRPLDARGRGRAQVKDVWKLITNLLPTSTTASGGVLDAYTGTTALLFNVKITDRQNVQTGKTVPADASYALTESAASSYDSAAAKTELQTVFTNGGKNDVRSEYAFFKRLYNGSTSYFESRLAASADRIGSAVTIFSDKDFPKGAGFVLNSIDVKELYNLLNSGKEFPILFAGQGCHNTQAIIEDVAKSAKRLGVPVVYVVDFSLDSNVKFGTGAQIDTVFNNGAISGLWIRSNAEPTNVAKSGDPENLQAINNFSYLYGELTQYFKGWTTQNESKKTDSIKYYVNGQIGTASLTTDPFHGETIGSAGRNAVRLQVPFILYYDGSKALGKRVVSEWLHKDTKVAGNSQTYTEYMLELSWVRATAKAKGDKQKWADGLTKVQFASEAVKALDSVLAKAFTKSSAPKITGTAKAGKTLTAKAGTYSPAPKFTYQWYANGKAIKGATKASLKLKAAQNGKTITVKVTAKKAGYATQVKTSKATKKVAK